MSAWDIAGAVVWPLLFMLGCAVLCGTKVAEPLLWLVVIVGSLLGAIYCIARLLGAHA